MCFACCPSSRNFNTLKLFGNKTKSRILESRNSIPFFSYLPIEMATLKPREILSRRNNKVYIYFFSNFDDWMSDETSRGVCGIVSQVKNRTFYSCVLSILAFEWTWGWGWPCFDTNLLPFQNKFCSKNTSLHKKNMIYITKQEGLYQNKVNFSLVSTCNCNSRLSRGGHFVSGDLKSFVFEPYSLVLSTRLGVHKQSFLNLPRQNGRRVTKANMGYCWFAHDVTAAMLVVKKKSISLLWELNSIFM